MTHTLKVKAPFRLEPFPRMKRTSNAAIRGIYLRMPSGRLVIGKWLLYWYQRNGQIAEIIS